MEKINIAELLKDCPQGMELDCTMFEDVYFDNISDCGKFIYCYINYEDRKTSICFNKYGAYSNLDKSKCVIFPKGRTTWKGFHRPFRDGDIVTYEYENGLVSMILKKFVNFVEIHHHCALYDDAKGFIINNYIVGEPKYTHLATEEEKQKLFDAIKANGYKWNAETKTLEMLPKFKVGDRIKHIVGRKEIATIVGVEKLHYNLDSKVGISSFSISLQHEWELVPNKFDINTLKAFESRVLVRDNYYDSWKPSFWGYLRGSEFMYDTIRGIFRQCIPYENNEHLMNTADDCDDFYKTWEK